MAAVTVYILHPEPVADAGPLERLLGAIRARVAEDHRIAFAAAGAADVRLVSGPPDGRPFGERLRRIAHELPAGTGLVVLGSGAIPLATAADRRALVAAAGSGRPDVLANNRYSADVVSLGCAAELLADLPGDVTDNALPRWLGARGATVRDRAGVRRLQVDLDSPVDALAAGGWLLEQSRLIAAAAGVPDVFAAAERNAERLRAVARDPRMELLVAGRTSARTIGWLERRSNARVRALVEERGLRTSQPGQRPPASAVAMVLDRDGPAALGAVLARLADAAVVDTRVLLAHRHGADERAWPAAEDRYASDLLLADRVRDAWLADLTRAARDAPIPVLLGGHTVVGPGLPRLLGIAGSRAG